MFEKKSWFPFALMCIAIAAALISPILSLKMTQEGRAFAAPLASAGNCPALPPATGNVINVSTVTELQNAVAKLQSNTTILIADGVYDLSQTLVIDGGLTDVSIRGASGNRAAVVLRGKGMDNSSYGNTPHGFLIRNSRNLLIADLTIRDFYYHDIQIQGEQNAQAVHIFNLQLLDAGEQLVKVSAAGPPSPFSDDGIVECSYLAYTNRAKSWYTNAVDVIGGARWIIRDNVIENIHAPQGQLAGPAVLLWGNTIDSIVERNLFIECDRAIALGLSKPSRARDNEQVYDNQRSIARNNMIYRAGSGDVGISAWYAKDFKIYHNTILHNGTFPYGAIDYRFSVSNGEIAYNLLDAPIWQRDGAAASLQGNITDARPEWFTDPSSHDLHLTLEATAAIDVAAPLSDIVDDFDGESRPIGTAPDVGADEFGDPSDSPTFVDVPADHWAYDDIEALYQRGYIVGCELSPRKYCPDRILNRAEEAVYVVRGVHGAQFDPDDPEVEVFTDARSGEWFFDWTAQLYNDGYTSGCWDDPLQYCPLQENSVAEGCVFFLRMEKGPTHIPQDPVGVFTDVPADAWYARWVEEAYSEGILLPCKTEPSLQACPLDPLDRATAAYMMARAKGLTSP